MHIKLNYELNLQAINMVYPHISLLKFSRRYFSPCFGVQNGKTTAEEYQTIEESQH